MEENKFAWITLINSNEYFKGALGLYFSLQRVKTKYPFIIMVVENGISEDNIQVLKDLKIEYYLIKDKSFLSINDYNNGSHASTLNKFQMYNLKEKFNKLCFVDADVLFYKNLDYIFYFDYFFTKGFTGLISGGIFLLNMDKETRTFDEIYKECFLWDNDEQILNYLYLKELFDGPEFDYTVNGGLFHSAGSPKYWERFGLDNVNKIERFIYNYMNKKILENYGISNEEICEG